MNKNYHGEGYHDVNPDWIFPDVESDASEHGESGLVSEEILPLPSTKSRKKKKGTEDDYVEMFIPADHVELKESVKITINCTDYIIPVGESVRVPGFVRDFWINMNKDKLRLNKDKKRFEDR